MNKSECWKTLELRRVGEVQRERTTREEEKRKTVDELQTTEDWAEEEEESKRIPLEKKLKIESR